MEKSPTKKNSEEIEDIRDGNMGEVVDKINENKKVENDMKEDDGDGKVGGKNDLKEESVDERDDKMKEKSDEKEGKDGKIEGNMDNKNDDRHHSTANDGNLSTENPEDFLSAQESEGEKDDRKEFHRNQPHKSKIIESKVMGIVKWYSIRSHYGFIVRENTSESIFVHMTSISRPNSYLIGRSLGEGESVQFNLAEGPKGLEAICVTGPDGSDVEGSPYALPKTFVYRNYRPVYRYNNQFFRGGHFRGNYRACDRAMDNDQDRFQQHRRPATFHGRRRRSNVCSLAEKSDSGDRNLKMDQESGQQKQAAVTKGDNLAVEKSGKIRKSRTRRRHSNSEFKDSTAVCHQSEE